MIKKILLIFVLFTISLFGQFIKHGDSFSVGVEEKFSKDLEERQGVSCRIFTFDNEPVRIVVSFIAPEKPRAFSIENTIFHFSEDLTKNGTYYGVIYGMEDITFILKSIVNGKYIYLTSEKITYIFDFSEYKNDIAKSKFYQKLIEEY